MTTFLIVTAWLASLALVAWLEFKWGYERGARGQYERGHADGWKDGDRAAAVVIKVSLDHTLTQYPTSRGLRAAIKAMGGSVPPLPRRKGAK